jgi:type II secretory pathway pseudopilin PulG
MAQMQGPPTIDYATPLPKKSRSPLIWIMLAVALAIAALLLLGFLFTARRSIVAQVRAQQAQVAANAAAARVRALVAPKPPFRMTIQQRERKAMPGTNGSVIVRLGDITHGQVLLSIDDPSGNSLLSTVSVHEGDIQSFSVAGQSFEIEIVELKNFLTSEDYGVFAIRSAGAALSEDEKINRLIESVEHAKGITFIRNGEAHDEAAAAQHLRRKYQSAGQKPMTVRQFVDELASRSSTSGEEYRIKLPDGREVSSQKWLLDQLEEIEAHAPASQPAQ